MMGLSYSTIQNLSCAFKEYPPGCIQCQGNYSPGNPGTFEELHKKFDCIEFQHFGGARFIIKKNLSKHFYVTHSISINPRCMTLYSDYKNSLDQKVLEKAPPATGQRKIESDDGYKFAVGYTGLKRVNQERYPIFYGDIKPNGDLIANFCHTLGCRIRVKLDAFVKKSKYENLKATMEYRSDDFTLTATLVDPSIFKQRGVLLLQYLQSITTRLAAGLEIACNNNTSVKQTNLAGALRYSNGFQTITATVGESALRVCYHHKESQHLQMGVEFQSNFVRNESKGKILFQVSPPMYDFCFKGFFDSNLLVGAVLERRLYPIPEASLLISTLFDPRKSDISIGVGFTIE